MNQFIRTLCFLLFFVVTGLFPAYAWAEATNLWSIPFSHFETTRPNAVIRITCTNLDWSHGTPNFCIVSTTGGEAHDVTGYIPSSTDGYRSNNGNPYIEVTYAHTIDIALSEVLVNFIKSYITSDADATLSVSGEGFTVSSVQIVNAPIVLTKQYWRDATIGYPLNGTSECIQFDKEVMRQLPSTNNSIRISFKNNSSGSLRVQYGTNAIEFDLSTEEATGTVSQALPSAWVSDFPYNYSSNKIIVSGSGVTLTAAELISVKSYTGSAINMSLNSNCNIMFVSMAVVKTANPDDIMCVEFDYDPEDNNESGEFKFLDARGGNASDVLSALMITEGDNASVNCHYDSESKSFKLDNKASGRIMIRLTAGFLAQLPDNPIYGFMEVGKNIKLTRGIILRLGAEYITTDPVTLTWGSPGQIFVKDTDLDNDWDENDRLILEYSANGEGDIQINDGKWNSLQFTDASGFDRIENGVYKVRSAGRLMFSFGDLFTQIMTTNKENGNVLCIQGSNVSINNVQKVKVDNGALGNYTSITQQYWSGAATALSSESGFNLTTALITSLPLGTKTLRFNATQTGDSPHQIVLKCATCGTETTLDVDHDGIIAHVLGTENHAYVCTDRNNGFRVSGQNVSVNEISIHVAQTLAALGDIIFPLYHNCNTLTLPNTLFAGAVENSTLDIRYTYEAENSGSPANAVITTSIDGNDTNHDQNQLNGTLSITLTQALLSSITAEHPLVINGHDCRLQNIVINAPQEQEGGVSGGNGSNAVTWDFTSKTDYPYLNYNINNHTLEDTRRSGLYLKYHGDASDGFVHVGENSNNAIRFFKINAASTFDSNHLPTNHYFEIRVFNKEASFTINQLYTSTGWMDNRENFSIGSYFHVYKSDGTLANTSEDYLNPVASTYYGWYQLRCNETYYITFDGPVQLTGINYSANVPTFETSLEATYSVAPGSNVPLVVGMTDKIANYNYQWYQNSARTYEGAVAIPVVATSPQYLAHSNTDGSTSYMFCAVSTGNKEDPNAMAFSNIAIINPPQGKRPTAPHIFYEFTEIGTRISLYNHGNYSNIVFTSDGSDPITNPNHTAALLETYDGIHAIGSNITDREVTVKAYCPMNSAHHVENSNVSQMTIPVLDKETQAVVVWNHTNSFYVSDPGIMPQPTVEVVDSHGGCFDMDESFVCRGSTMTKLTHHGAKADAAHADHIKLTYKLKNFNFIPQRACFRVNKLSKNTCYVKMVVKAVNRDGSLKYEGSEPCYLEFTVDPTYEKEGWFESDIPFSAPDYSTGWRITKDAQDSYEVHIYAWGLDDGESIGLSNITVLGKKQSWGNYHPFEISPTTLNLVVGTPGVISLQNASANGSAVVAVSANTAVATATVSDNKETVTVTPVAAGTTGVAIISKEHDDYNGAHFEDQQKTVFVSVTDDEQGRQYQLVNGDFVIENFTPTKVATNKWIAYDGYRGYAQETSKYSISTTTDERIPEERTYDMLLMTIATSVSFNVKGAASASFYTRGGGASAHLTIEVDGHIHTTNSQLPNLSQGDADMSYVNLDDILDGYDKNQVHTITVLNQTSDKFYIYGVKFSSKKTMPIALRNNTVNLNMEDTQSINLSDLITIGVGDNISNYIFTVPDGANNPYIGFTATQMKAKAQGATVVNITRVENENYRKAANSAEVVITRQETTLALNESRTWNLSGISENDGEYYDLYWDAACGIINDGRDATLVGQHGLLSTKATNIHFNLPSEQMGGVLTITYGPRQFGTIASVMVNSKGAKETVCPDATSPKVTQQSWIVNKGITTITLSGQGDTDAGVINQINWRPMQPDASFPGDEDKQDYSVTINGQNIPTTNLDAEHYPNYSLQGENVYILPTNTVIHLNVGAKYIRKIVVIGTSNDQFDASYITIPGCKSETGYVLPGFEEEYNMLEFVPEEQLAWPQNYEIHVSNQAAVVGIYIYTFDYSRDVTGLGVKGKLGSICLPKAVGVDDFVGARFFEIAYKDAYVNGLPTKMVLQEVDRLEAGMPYIFWASAERVGLYYTNPNSGIEEATPSHKNGLYGAYEKHNFSTSPYAELYTAEMAKSQDDKGYFLINDNKFKQYGPNSYVGANRAYIFMSEVPTRAEYEASVVSQASNANLCHLVIGGDDPEEENIPEAETAIEAIGIDIPTSNQFFDLNGRSVSVTTRGLYIKNNKVIFIR